MSDDLDHSQDNGWGWEALGSEDDVSNNEPNHIVVDPESGDKPPINKNHSDRSLPSRKNLSIVQGITSSPSFQELERAIGATLAMNLSSGEINEATDAKTSPSNGGYLTQRLSGTNLTQQKVMQQRMRQQYQQRGYNSQFVHKQLIPNAPHARVELSPFLNESESRALILFHSPSLSQVLVRETCSKFGVLYYIRPDFHAKGVTFISYFDLQSATSAKSSIIEALGSQTDVSVHYSIMLHATNSNSEESRLVVKNIPDSDEEVSIQSIFSRYGALRSIERTFGSSNDLQLNNTSSTKACTSYTIEFFNIQDCRLAASELSATSTTLWGPDTTVKFASLDDRKQQLCQQLLAILSRWRSEMAAAAAMISPSSVPPAPPPAAFSPYQHYHPPVGMSMRNNHGGMPFPFPIAAPLPNFVNNAESFGVTFMPSHMVHPNGSNVTLMSSAPNFLPNNLYLSPVGPPLQQVEKKVDLPQQTQYKGSDTNSLRYNDGAANNHGARHMGEFSPYGAHAHDQKVPENTVGNYRGGSYSSQAITSSSMFDNYSSSSSRRSARPPPNAFPYSAQSLVVDSGFNLNLEKINEGKENRTTLMVRNIPNKYSQQMLLEEVNLHHKGNYDFFYLPIDFKNRCNVGYCFINFIEPQFIIPFVEEFNGQRWRSFNSEKICAITFARIQGKAAMIARFQNSSLLEKDDEYKPLLFYSSGPEKGKPEPFPLTPR